MLACRRLLPSQSCSTSVLAGLLGLASTSILRAKQLPPRPKLEDTDITENFVKGTGPGGQKINKTASAVQLIHHPTGIVVKCQATRSRMQNRKIARTQLAERLELAEKGDESRIAQKVERAKKKKASATKKSKRKYRKLAEAKQGHTLADVPEEEELEDEVDKSLGDLGVGGEDAAAAQITKVPEGENLKDSSANQSIS